MTKTRAIGWTVFGMSLGALLASRPKRKGYSPAKVAFYVAGDHRLEPQHVEYGDTIEWRPWELDCEGRPVGKPFRIVPEKASDFSAFTFNAKTFVVSAKVLRRADEGSAAERVNYTITGRDEALSDPVVEAMPVGRCRGCD